MKDCPNCLTVQIAVPDYEDDTRLSDHERSRCHDLSNSLSSAFVWDETIEGQEFWSSVASRLRQLGDRGY